MIRRARKWIFLAVLVAAGLWYGWRHPKLLRAFGHVSAGRLCLLVGVLAVGKVLEGLQLRSIAAGLGIRLHFREWFGLTLCNNMYSYLGPGRAGVGVQAFYLKKEHGLPYAQFAALKAAVTVVALLMAALLGLLLCALSTLFLAPVPAALVWMFLALLAVTAAVALLMVLFMNSARLVPFKFLRSHANRAGKGLKTLLDRKAVLVNIALLRSVQLVVGSFALVLAFAAVGLDITMIQAITMRSLISLAPLLALTPGSLGITEGMTSGIAHLWNLSAETALTAALVRRGALMVLVFGLGLLYSHVLLARFIAGVTEGKMPRPDGDNEAADDAVRLVSRC